MVNTIVMSQQYQTRPSEILGITDSYKAYIIDEFSLYLVNEITDDKGKIHWNKIKTPKDIKNTSNNNKELKEHIKQQQR